jgi:hypothetical protein
VNVPAGWRRLVDAVDGYSIEGRGPHGRTLRVLTSRAVELDGELWDHVSVSVPGKTKARPAGMTDLPTWQEMAWVHRQFLGDRWAYQLHPPSASYVDAYQVLHLWACATDGTPRLPDFTRGTGRL